MLERLNEIAVCCEFCRKSLEGNRFCMCERRTSGKVDMQGKCAVAAAGCKSLQTMYRGLQANAAVPHVMTFLKAAVKIGGIAEHCFR